MTNWDKILARGIVRKTVALHPLWDQYIRVTQSIILSEHGMDASYSLALNYMLLSGFFLVVHQGIDEETIKMMLSFLEDKEIINTLNHDDLEIRYEKEMIERLL